MKDIIEKKNLNQSIELISELNLDEEDFDKIFENFNEIMSNPDINKIIKKILGFSELEEENDLIPLMKKLSDKLSINELNLLLGKVIKNEGFVNFIQDLFLEKLL